jgi:hypothetical protein
MNTLTIANNTLTIANNTLTIANKSKEWWEKELLKEVKLLERKEQIERGEFI